MIERPVKITFGEMREMGVRGILISAIRSRSPAIAGPMVSPTSKPASSARPAAGAVPRRAAQALY
jgi:hypothetical protein